MRVRFAYTEFARYPPQPCICGFLALAVPPSCKCINTIAVFDFDWLFLWLLLNHVESGTFYLKRSCACVCVCVFYGFFSSVYLWNVQTSCHVSIYYACVCGFEKRFKGILIREACLPTPDNLYIKVQVHDQIFFAKDCMPCNRLCRNCSCYWSIFRRCLSLNKGLPL